MNIMNKKQGCSCKKCQECCTREPGWFIPEEIPIAAKYINLSERDFIDKYCEEHNEDGILAISPKQKPNKTVCIFLDDDNLCQIHPVKPYECRKVFACKSQARHKRIRELIKRKWK